MLQNSRVTAFNAFELLRENQLGGSKITPSTQISVKCWVLVIFFGKIYFKINLSQIIVNFIKIQAIKISHDYDNNLT